MAVKVCINGQMKKIDTTIHKPVIFINGQKKTLAKAWVFINGEKKMLWGQPGVQVDLIKSDGLVSGVNNIKAIGDDWLVTTSGTNLNRINISNLSAPSLTQTVAWGSGSNSGFLSNSTKLVFYGVNGNTLNRLACDYSTGAVSVENSYTMSNSTAHKIGDIGNSSIGTSYRTTNVSGSTFKWGSNIYVNNSFAYQIGNYSSTTSYGPLVGGAYCQYSSTEWYIHCAAQGAYSSQNGLSKMTTSSVTKVNATWNLSGAFYLDGSYIVGKRSYEIVLLDKSSLAVAQHTELADVYYDIKLVGRSGEYYYVIKYPRTASSNMNVTLYLLDKDDLSTVYTQALPLDPFGEFNGTSQFWNNCEVSAQTTGSSFLGVSGSVSGKLRIVRFSELL